MERSELHVQMFGVVHCHDEDDELFIVYPNKIAFGMLVAPLSGGDDSVADKLNLLMSQPWPEHTLLQITQYASPDLVGITTQYSHLRRAVRDPLLRELSAEHVEFLRNGAFNAIDAKTNIRLRDTRVAITVQIPFKGAFPTDQEWRRAKELRVAFEQVLETAQVYGIRITPKVYIRLMETILNHAPDAGWKRSPLTTYDDKELICTQILDPGSSIEVDPEGKGLWLNGSTRVRVLSPKRYPDMLYFGLAMSYLTDWKQGARGIRENALVTLNIYFPAAESEKSKMEKKQMWNTQQASTPIAKYIKIYRDMKLSSDAILNEVEKGDRIVHAYLSMAVFTHGEGSDEAARALTEEKSIAASINAQSYWSEFQFKMMEDRYMVQPFFSQLLPFATDEGLRKSLERYRIMSGRHATCLMPIMGQWRGTGTPLFTLIGRDGQVQPVSPWDTDGNMNFMCCAASGSGKSVFCQNVVANMRSIDGRVWVIDVGDSYKNLCETMDGTYVEFGSDRDPCINPFTLVQKFDDEVDMLVDLLGVMIAPSSGLSDYTLPALKQALTQLWDAHQHAVTIDMIAERLLAHPDKRVCDMGEQLFPFTSRGSYGRYFAGPNNIGVSADLTVLELGALKAKPHLQRVVLLSLMFQIGQAVYHGDASRKQMLLVDEAWSLLASDETADFIERAYRQFRKHEASVGIITQSVMDVYQNKGGRAIAENSAHIYLLKQLASSIDAVQAEKKLPIGEWGYNMLKTVHTQKGQYSEIMCITPKGLGIGRLILNDFQRVLFSTDGAERHALKVKRERGLTLAEAINEFIAERNPGRKNAKRAAA